MNQIYPDAGLLTLLGRLASPNLYYDLFTNNVTPDRDTGFGALAIAAWGGYVQQVVPVAAFTAGGIAGHVGTILAPPVNFPNTSGSDQGAYGYVIRDTAAGTMIAIARFDGAPLTVPNGTGLSVFPILGDFSKFSS